MAQWGENRGERVAVWLLAPLLATRADRCNYHLASAHIRRKHRFVMFEHQTRFTDDGIPPIQSNHLPFTLVTAKFNLYSPMPTPGSNIRSRFGIQFLHHLPVRSVMRNPPMSASTNPSPPNGLPNHAVRTPSTSTSTSTSTMLNRTRNGRIVQELFHHDAHRPVRCLPQDGPNRSAMRHARFVRVSMEDQPTPVVSLS
jgi:hypothetical protein